jgi:hypothetical protein
LMVKSIKLVAERLKIVAGKPQGRVGSWRGAYSSTVEPRRI